MVPQPTFQIILVTFVPCTPFFHWRGKLRNTYCTLRYVQKGFASEKSSHKREEMFMNVF